MNLKTRNACITANGVETNVIRNSRSVSSSHFDFHTLPVPRFPCAPSCLFTCCPCFTTKDGPSKPGQHLTPRVKIQGIGPPYGPDRAPRLLVSTRLLASIASRPSQAQEPVHTCKGGKTQCHLQQVVASDLDRAGIGRLAYAASLSCRVGDLQPYGHPSNVGRLPLLSLLPRRPFLSRQSLFVSLAPWVSSHPTSMG